VEESTKNISLNHSMSLQKNLSFWVKNKIFPAHLEEVLKTFDINNNLTLQMSERSGMKSAVFFC
jgi:hypothetical protein